MNGKLIVIEGASDGIGKTTQFDLLRKRLLNENINVVSHHFPSYDTYQGRGVEEYLKGSFGNPKDLSPYFVNSLYAVDRAITWNTVLRDKYENGDLILLDRYTTSSLIYQSALIDDLVEKKKFLDYVVDFEYNKIGIKSPDRVIFLTADLDVITEMRKKRKLDSGEAIEGDIHENDLSFMKKVYDNALFVANYLSWDIVNCSENGKMKSIEEISDEIYDIISLQE